MSRDFHLKHFLIRQQHAAMKVGTDAIVLGSWLAQVVPNTEHYLDVGTGTGIIALMLAQAFEGAQGSALEVDQEALLDARINVSTSPYVDRLEVVQADFLSWTKDRYDLIVSNPPYFDMEGLPSPEQRRRLARHEAEGGLTLRRLMLHARSLLTPQGYLALITPNDREADLRLYAAEGLLRPELLTRVEAVADRPIRLLSLWRPLASSELYETTTYDTLVLRHTSGRYTEAYQTLTSPYLLESPL